MFSRLKTLTARFRRGVTNEISEAQHDLDVSPGPEQHTAEVQEKRSRVAEILEPVDKNWDFIEKTLLWKNALPACTCFFIISGLFWKFINLKLRKIALIFGGFLLANGISSDFRAASWDFFTTNFNLQTQGDPVLQFTFDDLCLFIATSWVLLANAVKSFQELNKECPPKFYCILAVSLFSLLALFTYFPVAELMYISICVIFFYPAMHYYGIADRLHARFERLSAPVLKHWENNRTKRKRVAIKPYPEKEQEQLYDSDDEFILEKNQFTTKVLSSVLPDDDIQPEAESDTDDEEGDDEIPHPDFDADFYTESQFEENLEMPSMSNFDSLMEPYDEFHSGLKFPDYTDSSRMDTLNILDAAANNLDTDEEMDDLPYEPEARRFSHEGFPNEGSGSHVSDERSAAARQPGLQSTFKRHTNRPRDEDPVLRHTETVTKPDLIADECTNAVEADFEFLEHCDLDEEADIPMNHQVSGQAEHTMTSYTESGMATLSKWLGYQ